MVRALGLILLLILSIVISHFHLLNAYYQFILMTIGINIILTLSLNLVNGYLGEFSVGHAGFMSIGAYTASLLTLNYLPANLFIIAVIAAGCAAAVVGFIIAILSFKTRGDYLAILTLALLMIVKSIIENIDSIGGPRGLVGIPALTNLPWVLFWLIVTLWLMRNLIYSRFGRHIIAIREDETAARLMGINTRQTKIIAFAISAFFTGVAGALYVHLLQFVNPSMFDLAKSTDMLIMVYLGGIGSITGSIIGGTTYTLILEILRPLGAWRMIILPLLLIVLMIYRRSGLYGLRESWFFIPKRERV